MRPPRSAASNDAPPLLVRAELDRILASEIFSRSDRLSAFLSFIVDQTLNGHGDSLKEQVIAEALYGKSGDFSTAADPIVRVDARRLRDKLREYYATAPHDPIVIAVHKGSYTPVFEISALHVGRAGKALVHAGGVRTDIPSDERVFLPRNASPPFQTVVFFPAGQAYTTRSSAYLETRQVQFLIQSGRAVLYPVYRGTFDRWVETRGLRENRDQNIMDVKDFNRCVDYLETRPDIDRTRLGFYGISAGANMSSLLLANDHRLTAAVLLGAGLAAEPDLPEVDPINFVSRVTTPVLMLNGRYDFVEPVETSQRPMFDLLGTPAADKRHVIFETGHAVVTLQPMIKEVLDWLDKYLGPVQMRAQ